MNTHNRVLAYGKSIALDESELMDISGGNAASTSTMTHVQKVTGSPVPNDIEFVQVWD